MISFPNDIFLCCTVGTTVCASAPFSARQLSTNYRPMQPNSSVGVVCAQPTKLSADSLVASVREPVTVCYLNKPF